MMHPCHRSNERATETMLLLFVNCLLAQSMCSFESDNISWQRINDDASKNMDAANVYAVMNIIAFFCTVPFVVINEASTLQQEWDTSVRKTWLARVDDQYRAQWIIFLHLQ